MMSPFLKVIKIIITLFNFQSKNKVFKLPATGFLADPCKEMSLKMVSLKNPSFSDLKEFYRDDLDAFLNKIFSEKNSYVVANEETMNFLRGNVLLETCCICEFTYYEVSEVFCKTPASLREYAEHVNDLIEKRIYEKELQIRKEMEEQMNKNFRGVFSRNEMQLKLFLNVAIKNFNTKDKFGFNNEDAFDLEFFEFIKKLSRVELDIQKEERLIYDLSLKPLTSLIYNKLKAQFLELCEKDPNAIHSA
jgi:hypothetical protein